MTDPDSRVPPIRIRATNKASVRPDGDVVLYWMTAFRRLEWNFSLDRAVDWACELGKPLVILEALRIGYPWASERLHTFVIEGMHDNLRRARQAPVVCYPYVEREPGAGKGLLAALAENASVVVTDDYPCFFLPRMIAAASEELQVRLEAVDSNGLLPLRATERIFKRAVDFRRFLQKELPEHLDQAPRPDGLARCASATLEDQGARAGDRRDAAHDLLARVRERWPPATEEELADPPAWIGDLKLDDVPAAPIRGGAAAGRRRWREFLDGDLGRYAEGRNDPDDDRSSRLSPYLHFGHLSTHEVFHELAGHEGWTPMSLGSNTQGQRQGWWGMGNGAEAFLDQMVTWRELGYNMTSHAGEYDTFDSLPEWARNTIEEHRDDPREWIYSPDDFESAETHDEVWNAAQRQLLREGRIHNYLRMLWGKKIFEWSEEPEEALRIMIDLNNRYALDGRDPNSYSGIFWCLGRYDRAWGPERPIYGKLRYMTSENTRRKLSLDRYLQEFGP